MANKEVSLDRIRTLDFFAGFSDDELRQVVQLSEEIDADLGAELTEQGRTGDVAYVILDGTASVTMAAKQVATVGPGETVGEMALLSHKPRNATVTATTAMKLLALDTRQFKALLEKNPRVMDRITTELNARIRQQDRQ